MTCMCLATRRGEVGRTVRRVPRFAGLLLCARNRQVAPSRCREGREPARHQASQPTSVRQRRPPPGESPLRSRDQRIHRNPVTFVTPGVSMPGARCISRQTTTESTETQIDSRRKQLVRREHPRPTPPGLPRKAPKPADERVPFGTLAEAGLQPAKWRPFGLGGINE